VVLASRIALAIKNVIKSGNYGARCPLARSLARSLVRSIDRKNGSKGVEQGGISLSKVGSRNREATVALSITSKAVRR